MSRGKNYKYAKGDKIGLYEIIKPLPSEPNVKNLVIYCTCLLCGEKVKRWSNRLDSKHRGCKANAIVKKPKVKQTEVVHPMLHTRADGTKVRTNKWGFTIDDPAPKPEQVVEEATAESGDDAEEFNLPDPLDLPDEVKNALNVDVNAQAIEIIKKADGLDASTRFVFINTFKRYLTLVHIARRLEAKMNRADVELTVIGSTGKWVANPLIVQYKQVSSESNATVKILLGMVSKMTAGDDANDPLLEALRV